MLRALKATDVASIYEINKDALGYDFSPEETAGQLAKFVSRPPSLPIRF